MFGWFGYPTKHDKMQVIDIVADVIEKKADPQALERYKQTLNSMPLLAVIYNAWNENSILPQFKR
jgi:hypothetical protein